MSASIVIHEEVRRLEADNPESAVEVATERLARIYRRDRMVVTRVYEVAKGFKVIVEVGDA